MDPSMLIAFLIQSEDDWMSWKRSVNEMQGKKIVHIGERDPALYSLGVERDGAIDEVESFDDEDDDMWFFWVVSKELCQRLWQLGFGVAGGSFSGRALYGVYFDIEVCMA